jgi:hypothetical protein
VKRPRILWGETSAAASLENKDVSVGAGQFRAFESIFDYDDRILAGKPLLIAAVRVDCVKGNIYLPTARGNRWKI